MGFHHRGFPKLGPPREIHKGVTQGVTQCGPSYLGNKLFPQGGISKRVHQRGPPRGVTETESPGDSPTGYPREGSRKGSPNWGPPKGVPQSGPENVPQGASTMGVPSFSNNRGEKRVSNQLKTHRGFPKGSLIGRRPRASRTFGLAKGLPIRNSQNVGPMWGHTVGPKTGIPHWVFPLWRPP